MLHSTPIAHRLLVCYGAHLVKDGKFVDGKIYSFIQGHRIGPRRDASNLVPKDIRSLTLEDFKDNKLEIADDGTIKPKK